MSDPVSKAAARRVLIEAEINEADVKPGQPGSASAYAGMAEPNT